MAEATTVVNDLAQLHEQVLACVRENDGLTNAAVANKVHASTYRVQQVLNGAVRTNKLHVERDGRIRRYYGHGLTRADHRGARTRLEREIVDAIESAQRPIDSDQVHALLPDRRTRKGSVRAAADGLARRGVLRRSGSSFEVAHG